MKFSTDKGRIRLTSDVFSNITGAVSEETLNAYLDLLVEYSKSLETAQQ